MIELTVKTSMSDALMTREAATLAAKMGAYQSRVLLRAGNITVNAKSLMGLVSLGMKGGMSVTLIAEGVDEAEAATELARQLGA